MTRLSGETALGLAWIIALTASLAVLFIGEVLGQTPCVLCWFQRAFLFPLALILGLGLWWVATGSRWLWAVPPSRFGTWASMSALSPSVSSPARRPAHPVPTTINWSSAFRFL